MGKNIDKNERRTKSVNRINNNKYINKNCGTFQNSSCPSLIYIVNNCIFSVAVTSVCVCVIQLSVLAHTYYWESLCEGNLCTGRITLESHTCLCNISSGLWKCSKHVVDGLWSSLSIAWLASLLHLYLITKKIKYSHMPPCALSAYDGRESRGEENPCNYISFCRCPSEIIQSYAKEARIVLFPAAP